MAQALHFSEDAYYAPVPMIRLDREGGIVDVNLAAEVLFGDAVFGRRAQPLRSLLEALGPSVDGAFVPPEGEWVRGGESEGEPNGQVCLLDGFRPAGFVSDAFGRVDLRGMALCHTDPRSGEPSGVTFAWEVVAVGHERLFREALTRIWHHHLTWEIYATSYDRILPLLPFYQEVVGRHVEAMTAPGIRAVADIGAGTGNVTLPLLRAGLRVTAIDIGRSMLDRLRSKVTSEEAESLTVMEQSAERLPLLRDASFDGVTVLLAFYDMSRPDLALHEALRILRPGGTFVATEPKLGFNLKVLLDFGDFFFRPEGTYGYLGADWERVTQVNQVLDPAPRARLRAEKIRDVLSAEGFQDVAVRDSHMGQCATVTAQKP